MAIVRRRKKVWYTKELELQEDVVKIRLNDSDMFEFDLPEAYSEVFNATEFHTSREFDISKNGAVRFNVLGVFDDIFDELNQEFKSRVVGISQERVLVVFIEGRTEVSEVQNVFRLDWGNNLDVHTFINFKFERGLRVGNSVFKVYGGVIGEWERKEDQFRLLGPVESGSKETSVIIPYTEEREQFLISFQKELSAMVERVDSFMDIFDNPATLEMIDNRSHIGLLDAPVQMIENEEIIDAEEVN